MNYKIIIFFIAALLLAACSTSVVETAPTFTPQQQHGQAVFNLRCAQCHATVPDTVVIGPSLNGIATRAATRVEGYSAEEYIERSILIPDFYVVEGFANTMPTNFGKELTSEELSALVSYVMTFK